MLSRPPSTLELQEHGVGLGLPEVHTTCESPLVTLKYILIMKEFRIGKLERKMGQ